MPNHHAKPVATATEASRLPFGRRGTPLAIAFLAAAVAWASPTGEKSWLRTAQADEEGDASERRSIQIVEPLGLEIFLRALSQETDRPLVWDPTNKAIRDGKIQGGLNLEGPKDGLFDMSRALLTFFDLVMIPVGPAEFEALIVTEASKTSGMFRLKPEYIEITAENIALYENLDGKFVTTSIRVENMSDLRAARNALQRLVTGQNLGSVTEIPQARSFLVTDFAPNVAAIWRLLRTMDVKPTGSTLVSRYFQLDHATADEMEPILTDLFTGQDRITRDPTARALPGAAAGGESGAIDADPEARIIGDPRTNQIIVWAIQRDVEEIAQVIEKLDVPVYIQRDRIKVIRLKNLEAVETAEVLSSLIEAASIFGGGTAGAGARSTSTSGPAGRVSSSELDPRNEEKPAVVADEKSNSLIIASTERQFDEIKRVVDEIDVQKDQVLIEAALIELTLDDSYRLAFELGVADDKGLTDSGSVSGFGLTSFGQTVMADKDGDTYFTDRIPAFVDSGDNAVPRGLVGGIFAFGQVPLIFNVLNAIQRSRILQLPSIVTADNEEAVIAVQDEQAFSESNAATGGAVTGGLGGFETAGTTLRISPHIADSSYLLLNINLEVSAFVGEARQLPSGDQIPADRIRRSINTVVTVPDRHTVVLGGLMGRTQRSSDDKVPYMSELPIVGELFKNTSRSDRETNLFLFVTPTIMHGGNAFGILDIESCRRKQKADELIGFTEIYNAKFVGCDLDDEGEGKGGQDVDCGCYGGRRPSVRAPAGGTLSSPRGAGSGSTSGADRLDSIGMLEATRFHAVSPERLDAERNARRAALRGAWTGPGSAPAATAPRAAGGSAARPAPRAGGFQVGPNQAPASSPATRAGFGLSSGSASGLDLPRGYWKTGGS